jgi:hypothetical protein
MTMPEATVDEDRLLQRWKHQVGSSWEIAAVESESIPQSMRDPASRHLGRGILPAHASHERGTSPIYRFARKELRRVGVPM